jgi:hypothetical protein
MLATATKSTKAPANLHRLLEQIKVDTGQRCTPEASRQFLMSTSAVTKVTGITHVPTAQEMECLRQATFKHRLETGADRATAADLMPTLQRLGYV